MVKLERAEKPDVWTDKNVEKWTKNWQKKIARENAGGTKAKWEKWPQANRELINRTATRNMREWHSYKCAFCEVQNDGTFEIEHFYPKKLYPDRAFEWANLFLSCGRCNGAKNEGEPDNCLKPDIDDPSEYLWFSPALQRIVPKYGISEQAKVRAEKTIKLYDLESMSTQYQLYWRKIILESHTINLARLSINDSGDNWIQIGDYIRKNYPAIKKRAKSTEEFSLMVRSVIDEYVPASKTD